MMSLSSLSKAIALQVCGVMLALVLIALGYSITAVVILVLFIGGSCFYVRKAARDIKSITAVCLDLKSGDLERRLTHIKGNAEIADLKLAVNDMADVFDAYIRESSAAMDYVSRNQYFRRILEGGLNGALLNGACTINSATNVVQQKMDDFSAIADDVDDSLKVVVTDLKNAINDLDGNANEMLLIASSTAQESDGVVQSSNDTSMNVQAISAAVEEMSATIAEISQQISLTSNIAKNAENETAETKGVIQNLAQSIDNISNIASLIEDIAGQTNLLALNATIEAARAGEAGKGFAVVASEVKLLANETAQATEQIRSQIAEIQSVTISAVSAFDEVGKVISDISQACMTVASAVKQQSCASQEIASNVDQASTATLETASNMNDIGNNIKTVDQRSKDVMFITEKLGNESQKSIEHLLSKMSNFMNELRKIA